MDTDKVPIESRSPVTTPVRLWRPAAQRNLRNQWSKLLSAKNRWTCAISDGRSSATGLVNAYLSRRYLPTMELGVLKDMPEIRSKASHKLSQQQELYRAKLLSSYKDMVGVISDFVKASASMRCFVKGSNNNSLMQFCNYSEDKNDLGDGGGASVFSSWPIASFEELSEELVKMFVSDLNFKRLLVVELLDINTRGDSEEKKEALWWSNEIYPGELHDLSECSLLSKESKQPFLPRIGDWETDSSFIRQPHELPDREVLQVYLTAWITHLHIDMNRVAEIFEMVEEVMQVKLS